MANKRMWLGMLVTVLVLGIFFTGCVSMKDREINYQERASVKTVDQVTVKFTSWQIFHIPNFNKIKNKAYLELKKVAQEKYGKNADVANITITGGWTPFEIFNIVGNVYGIPAGILIGAEMGGDGSDRSLGGLIGGGVGIVLSLFAGNSQKITAIGDVILYN